MDKTGLVSFLHSLDDRAGNKMDGDMDWGSEYEARRDIHNPSLDSLSFNFLSNFLIDTDQTNKSQTKTFE